MHFLVNASDINAGMSLVSHALSARPMRQVYEGVLLETADEGLYLTCTDGEMTIRTRINATIQEEGVALMPAKLFGELLRKLSGEIDINIDKRFRAEINAQGSNTNMAGTDASEFPDVPEVHDKEFAIEMPQNKLRDAVGRIMFAVSTDETRRILTGILMEIFAEEIRFVGLDGFRLALQRVEQHTDLPEGKESVSAIIPGRILGEFARMLGESDEPARVVCGKNRFCMTFDDTTCYTSLLTGEFINYKQILPSSWQSQVKLRRDDFISAIERASLMAREGKNNLLRLALTQAKVSHANILSVDTSEAEKMPGVFKVITAKDIVAETIAENPDAVADLRAFTEKTGSLCVEATDPAEQGVYDRYYGFSEALRRIPNHRVLAINRGEKEGKLKVRVSVDADAAIARLGKHAPRRRGAFADALDGAVADGYKPLMAPSLERGARAELTERAQRDAIRVFAQNTRSLLLQRPVRGARIIALDPGYRTGCKVAVLDENGKLLDHTTVYPTPPRSDAAGTKRVLDELAKRHHANTVVIGNGTGSRETEEVVSDFIAELAPDMRYTIVNEAGAPVYSASELASKEYPDLDVTTRGAMSLGRRLQDPLSELVKIPPASIGVGQYQHDLSQAELGRALGIVVEDAVNSVGVNLNTASASLLGYVSGITPTIARNIVAFREENGPFKSRSQLKKVPKLGPKAFQNCAGFLRVPGGSNPLDATAVHPESYGVAKELLARVGVPASALAKGGVPGMDGLVHISKMAERFVRHPSEVVSVGDNVTVWVTGVDKARGKISLSMVKGK